jgi:hypothetical protein
VTAEIPEKEENHGNPLLHFVGNLENGNLKFIRKPKTRRHKKFGKRLNSWFVKNQSFRHKHRIRSHGKHCKSQKN